MRADLGCAELVGVEVLVEDGAVGVCQHALDTGVLVLQIPAEPTNDSRVSL